MNPSPKPEITVETLLALRTQENAALLIAEKLRVKEMGPADHIRTKHEVKAFLESGTSELGKMLLQNSVTRLGLIDKHVSREDIKQSNGLKMR